jgi:hypothetical protein
VNRNGLTVTTYFHGSVVVLCEEVLLGDHVGKAMREVTSIRHCLRAASGIGTGKGGRRGQIVAMMGSDFAPMPYFDYGLIVTSHGYSMAGKYQLIVPIVPGGVGVEVGDHVVRRADEAWISAVAQGTDEALLATPLLHSVWQDDAINDAVDALTVDDYTLDRVDEELCAYFRLTNGIA